MKQKINNVDLIDIDRAEALAILGEINKATGGGLKFSTKEYPQLNRLYDYLNSAFNSSKNGIHFIDKFIE